MRKESAVSDSLILQVCYARRKMSVANTLRFMILFRRLLYGKNQNSLRSDNDFCHTDPFLLQISVEPCGEK